MVRSKNIDADRFKIESDTSIKLSNFRINYTKIILNRYFDTMSIAKVTTTNYDKY